MYTDVCNELKMLVNNPKIQEVCASVEIALCAGSNCPPALGKTISKTFPTSVVQVCI